MKYHSSLNGMICTISKVYGVVPVGRLVCTRASSDDGGAFSRASNDSVSVPVDKLLKLGPASLSVPVDVEAYYSTVL